MSWIKIELGQEVPEHDWPEAGGADEDDLLPLLHADRVAQPLLRPEGLVQLLQSRDQVKDGRDDEEDDEDFAEPGDGVVAAVAHGTHGDHDEPECVEVVQVDIHSQHVVNSAYPGVGERVRREKS